MTLLKITTRTQKYSLTTSLLSTEKVSPNQQSVSLARTKEPKKPDWWQEWAALPSSGKNDIEWLANVTTDMEKNGWRRRLKYFWSAAQGHPRENLTNSSERQHEPRGWCEAEAVGNFCHWKREREEKWCWTNQMSVG